MRNIFRKKSEVEAEIAEFENLLRVTMRPVSARPGFVADLQNRLMNRGPETLTITEPQQSTNRWLLVSGIVGSVLMLITSIRGLVALYGVINLLVQRFNRNTLPGEASPAA